MRRPTTPVVLALSGLLLLAGCTSEGETTVDDLPTAGDVTGDTSIPTGDEVTGEPSVSSS